MKILTLTEEQLAACLDNVLGATMAAHQAKFVVKACDGHYVLLDIIKRCQQELATSRAAARSRGARRRSLPRTSSRARASVASVST